MTKTSVRPEKAVRDELRRDEIVAAARACVVRHGFHAASMAQIAHEAHMSVGQIYRYFPSKEAIIHAIVERIITQRLDWIAGVGKTADLPTLLAGRMFADDPVEHDNHVLLLEINAEATRNPVVAEMVKRADRMLHARAVGHVRENHPQLSEEEARARVEFVAVLSEGTAFRRLTDKLADQNLLAQLYREALASILPAKGGTD